MAGSTTTTLAHDLGRNAEKSALRFLKKSGLRLVMRNYRCRLGEIDLLMLDGKCLVVIEVRYRGSNSFTSAAVSVDRHKQAKLVRTAALFLSQHPEYSDFSVRFDVMAFNRAKEDNCELQWFKDAFRPE